MNDVSIRKATLNDITALQQLEQELIEFERPFDRFLNDSGVIYYDLDALISNKESAVFVAESGAEVVASGYGQMRESKPYIASEQHCYLGFIYVKSDFRGQGLSRKIVETLINWAKSQGVGHFLLDVYSDNDGAIGAYEKFGFKPRSVSMELMLQEHT